MMRRTSVLGLLRRLQSCPLSGLAVLDGQECAHAPSPDTLTSVASREHRSSRSTRKYRRSPANYRSLSRRRSALEKWDLRPPWSTPDRGEET